MNNGYILAVDVEATCEKDNAIPRHDMEIIEIGAVLLDDNLVVVDEFQTFVKPFRNPTLTPFCRELTHISQADVDNAPGVIEAFRLLGQWASAYQPMRWCSWGDYDNQQFKVDCAQSGAPWPFPGEHFNAKKEFSRIRGGKRVGLRMAVELIGLEWTGTHHRGIDDARNLAQILQQMMKVDTDQ